MKIPLKQRPLVFFDCETTGLDPRVHEILEVGAITESGDTYEAQIIPEHIDTAHPKALEINGYHERDWSGARPMSEVLPEIVAFLQDAVIAGQNIRFDMGFLNAAIEKQGLDIRVDYHLVDTSTLAYEHLVPLGLGSLSLKAVCEFLGIEPEPDVHRALNGAVSAWRVYNKVVRASWLKKLWWRFRASINRRRAAKP